MRHTDHFIPLYLNSIYHLTKTQSLKCILWGALQFQALQSSNCYCFFLRFMFFDIRSTFNALESEFLTEKPCSMQVDIPTLSWSDFLTGRPECCGSRAQSCLSPWAAERPLKALVYPVNLWISVQCPAGMWGRTEQHRIDTSHYGSAVFFAVVCWANTITADEINRLKVNWKVAFTVGVNLVIFGNVQESTPNRAISILDNAFQPMPS